MIRQRDDYFGRRAFLQDAARTFLGVGALPLLSQSLAAANPAVRRATGGQAQSVIYLYMSGGMSHLDTFDTKPGTETQGPVESIATSADGVQVSQFFPQLAKQMHHIAVVNSMNSTQGAHAQGNYFMHTSYFMRGTIKHPDLGAWSNYHLGKINPTLPGNVKIGGASNGLGGGFLESKYAALPIGDPKAGLQHSQLPRGVDEDRLTRRMARLKEMNGQFVRDYDTRETRAFAGMYDEAVRLMKSDDLKAFDLTLEDQAMRDRYGDNPFGQACLLARRLVQHGVRFVEVNNGGWDTHNDNFTRLAEKGAILDQAMAALFADLAAEGMLDNTLVVLATEFGRTPTIQTDRNNGRNHYPQAFSCLLGGGGIRGGIKYGRTDSEGREVEENLVSVPDFNATIAHALGIDTEKKVMSPSSRPFTVADKGKPILDLFA